jgi:mannose-6-phosphate isomerase-like protein (cupin superfamily)
VRDAYVINRDQLPVRGELEGYEHGDTGISLIFVDAAPGGGPGLHRHDYDEVFIVQEGEATMTAGERQITARAGDVVVVPAGMPHAFVNSGDGQLRQIDIHLNPRYATEWLDEKERDPYVHTDRS